MGKEERKKVIQEIKLRGKKMYTFLKTILKYLHIK